MISSNQFKINYNLLAIIISTLMLSSCAIYNGFPLVFNTDTAMYMEAVNRGIAGADRPILYGLFMQLASLGISLWFVIVVQCLIVALVLFYYFKYFPVRNDVSKNESRLRLYYFLGFNIFISFFMGGGFTASWLMPDIFTPIALLCLGLLIFIPNLKSIDKVIISVLAVLSVGMHNSNPYICLVVCLIALVSYMFPRVKSGYVASGIHIRRIFYSILLIIGSQFMVSVVHYYYGGEFKSSRGGVIFLMGSLVEMGVVKKYLNENCNEKNYFICQYKDSLPNNFLWNSKSPIYKNGGWKKNEAEYTAIIKDILTTPKYFGLVIKGSANVTIKQFFHYGTGEASKPWPRVNHAIFINYAEDYSSFENSKQSTGKLHINFINYVQTFLFAICALFYFIMTLYNKAEPKHIYLMFFVFFILVINAWFCSTFSGVFHRYQTRVVWLFPLPIFLHFMNRLSFKKKSS